MAIFVLSWWLGIKKKFKTQSLPRNRFKQFCLTLILTSATVIMTDFKLNIQPNTSILSILTVPSMIVISTGLHILKFIFYKRVNNSVHLSKYSMHVLVWLTYTGSFPCYCCKNAAG